MYSSIDITEHTCSSVLRQIKNLQIGKYKLCKAAPTVRGFHGPMFNANQFPLMLNTTGCTRKCVTNNHWKFGYGWDPKRQETVLGLKQSGLGRQLTRQWRFVDDV